MWSKILSWIKSVFAPAVEQIVIVFIKQWIENYLSKTTMNKLSITSNENIIKEITDAVTKRFGSCSPKTILEITKQVENMGK
jgi:predicted metal-dependent hydrolase